MTAGKRALALVKDTGTGTDTAAEPTPKAGGDLLHNAHDVDRLQAECQALCDAMAQAGAVVEMGLLEASSAVQGVLGIAQKKGLCTAEQVGRGGLWALLAWLVNSGVCTEDEAEGERLTAMREILRKSLQQVEAQTLQRPRGPQVQPVRKPGIVVARH